MFVLYKSNSLSLTLLFEVLFHDRICNRISTCYFFIQLRDINFYIESCMLQKLLHTLLLPLIHLINCIKHVPCFFSSVYQEFCNYHGSCYRYGRKENQFSCCCDFGEFRFFLSPLILIWMSVISSNNIICNNVK